MITLRNYAVYYIDNGIRKYYSVFRGDGTPLAQSDQTVNNNIQKV